MCLQVASRPQTGSTFDEFVIRSRKLSQAIAENGGATAIECGSTFGAALTATGVVVIWGGLPGAVPPPGARRLVNRYLTFS